MNFLNKSLFFLLLLELSACKNDIELNAPYKEIPSIYAVLNPQEAVQNIRINKVFLGEGDANKMAKVADSINYKPGELTVTLKHSSGAKVITFGDSVINALEGAFNPQQRVYVSHEKLATSGIYTLTVKNNHTGNVFTARSTPLIGIDPNQGFQPLMPPYYPYQPGTIDDNVAKRYVNYKSNNGSVIFAPRPDEAKIYQVTIRTHFYEELGSGRRYNSVDYVFNNRYPKEAEKVAGGLYIKTNFTSADYFGAIGIGLSQKNLSDDVLGRKVWMIEFLIYSSTQEYLDYLEYAKPSLSFNQNKPLYSNFDNQAALGIFTFRTTCSVQKEMSNLMINEFAYNSNTCRYRFYTSDNQLPGCK
jgi:hypothetical protein